MVCLMMRMIMICVFTKKHKLLKMVGNHHFIASKFSTNSHYTHAYIRMTNRKLIEGEKAKTIDLPHA